jgi:uncharacterized membrane protein
MFLAAALLWQAAPEQIPMHWNIAGAVDRYGGKLEGLLGIPAMTLGLYLLLRFLPRLDPGYANYQRFAKAYTVIRVLLVLFMAAIYAVILAATFGWRVDVGIVVPAMVGLLFVVLGNFMGKIRPNWFVGVRTPWTLSSKLSWTKTHRLAGWLFIAMGVALAASGFTRQAWAVFGAFGFLGACVAWMIVYSYLVWRKDPDRVPPAGTTPNDDATAPGVPPL